MDEEQNRMDWKTEKLLTLHLIRDKEGTMGYYLGEPGKGGSEIIFCGKCKIEIMEEAKKIYGSDI